MAGPRKSRGVANGFGQELRLGRCEFCIVEYAGLVKLGEPVEAACQVTTRTSKSRGGGRCSACSGGLLVAASRRAAAAPRPGWLTSSVDDGWRLR
jgi:hypothetical protein